MKVSYLISIILWSFTGGIWFSMSVLDFIDNKKTQGIFRFVAFVSCMLVSALLARSVINI